MKKFYKYVHFMQVPSIGKTSKWKCLNNHSKGELGEIRWYAQWRQYCYFPTVQAVYSAGCLDDISHFIGQLIDERKKPEQLSLMEEG